MDTANGPPLESEYAEKQYHYYICDRSDPRLSTDYLGAIVAEKNGAKWFFTTKGFNLNRECSGGRPTARRNHLTL
jgi:hypothetical protein